jgi:hypothetical protein
VNHRWREIPSSCRAHHRMAPVALLIVVAVPSAFLAYALVGVTPAAAKVALSRATPTMTTHASAPVAAGGTISDVATLAGGANPTGMITFTLFGPDNSTCSGAPVFTSPKTVGAGNGDFSSDPFTAGSVGTYRWVAAYSGDSGNNAATTTCNDATESTVVSKASPALTVGGDTATLSGGANPTGTITFRAFGPDNPTCTGTAVFTSVKTVTGDGAYTSDLFTPPGSGTYRFVVSYSGDANNFSTTSICGVVSVSVESPGFGPPPRLPRSGVGANASLLNQGGSLSGIPIALLMLAALGLISGAVAHMRRRPTFSARL